MRHLTIILLLCSCTALPGPVINPPQWQALQPHIQPTGIHLPSIEAVNAYVNRLPYHRVTEWQTPADMLAHGGDCKDYAIAKMEIIRENHLAANMQLLLVYDTMHGQQHLILTADGSTLDNQYAATYRGIPDRYIVLGVIQP